MTRWFSKSLPTRPMSVGLALLLLPILLFACTGGPSERSSYSSVDEMRRVIEQKVGIRCDTWEVFGGFNQGALQRAMCTDSIMISVYRDSSTARAAAAETAGLLSSVGMPSNFLVGQNWTANCGAYCGSLQTALGGEYIRR